VTRVRGLLLFWSTGSFARDGVLNLYQLNFHLTFLSSNPTNFSRWVCRAAQAINPVPLLSLPLSVIGTTSDTIRGKYIHTILSAVRATKIMLEKLEPKSVRGQEPVTWYGYLALARFVQRSKLLSDERLGKYSLT
jgi:hypothetical protein